MAGLQVHAEAGRGEDALLPSIVFQQFYTENPYRAMLILSFLPHPNTVQSSPAGRAVRNAYSIYGDSEADALEVLPAARHFYCGKVLLSKILL